MEMVKDENQFLKDVRVTLKRRYPKGAFYFNTPFKALEASDFSNLRLIVQPTWKIDSDDWNGNSLEESYQYWFALRKSQIEDTKAMEALKMNVKILEFCYPNIAERCFFVSQIPEVDLVCGRQTLLLSQI